jgi:adenylate cyclase
VNQVINDPEGLKISGSSETATVLFADIRGFTTLCEICSPQEIISFLHYYFNQATSVILKHKGMLDKYIGDAIVCFVQFPCPSSFAVDACKAAIEVAQVVEKSALR